MRSDLYGQVVEVERAGRAWRVRYVGNDGKQREAGDIQVPNDLEADEIAGYRDDLCHERTSQSHPCVRRLD